MTSPFIAKIMIVEGESNVIPLAEGVHFVSKQMQAASGTALQKHRASVESVLVVTEGQCIVALEGAEHLLRRGDSFVVPANVWHQITADPSFTAVHVMPKEIRFEFTK